MGFILVPRNQEDRVIDEELGEDYQGKPTPADATLRGRRPVVSWYGCAMSASGERLRFPFRYGGAVAGGGDLARGLRVVQRLEHPWR